MSVVGVFVSPSCLRCGQLQNNWWDTIWLSLIFTSCRYNQQDDCKVPLPSIQKLWKTNAVMHGGVMGDWKRVLFFRGVPRPALNYSHTSLKASGLMCFWWANCWCSTAAASLGLAFLYAGVGWERERGTQAQCNSLIVPPTAHEAQNFLSTIFCLFRCI